MATYSFTLRAGVTLSDAAVTYDGVTYNVKTELAAGAGTITTTNDSLAAELRGLLAGDGLPVLDEGGVVAGPAPSPLYLRPRREWLAPALPDAALVGDIFHQQDPVTGLVVESYEVILEEA